MKGLIMIKRLKIGWIIPPILLAAAIVLRFAGCTNSQDAPISEVTSDLNGQVVSAALGEDGILSSPFKYKLTIKGLRQGKTVPTIDPDKDPHKIYVPLYG